jgi:2-deoxy-D-gluconate 3-dehydrogenase
MTATAGVLEQFRLDGKVALVTGAAGGLGAALAEGLAEAGADLVVTSREIERLVGIADSIERQGRRCMATACDVQHPDQVRSLIARAEEEFGRLDILVNNAGTTHRDRPEDFPEAEWDRVLDVNLKSVFIACQEAGRRMIARGGGKIINMASMLSFTGGLYVPAYAASKGAVAQLTKALSNEWARHNVQVNAIAPGYFPTEMTRAIFEDPVRRQEILTRIPAGRWGAPSELKGAAVFLASEASNYVTGHILVVDGGWLAR